MRLPLDHQSRERIPFTTPTALQLQLIHPKVDSHAMRLHTSVVLRCHIGIKRLWELVPSGTVSIANPVNKNQTRPDSSH